MHFLGVKIDEITLEQARLKIRTFLLSPGQFKIFTPNPEIIVKAQKDEYFKQVLNSGDLNICDGFGLWLATGTATERIPGVDFMLEICKIAEETGKSIFLLGTEKNKILEKVGEELQKKFPKLIIKGWDKGPGMQENFQFSIQQFNNFSALKIDQAENNEILEKINTSGSDIVFVAFGMGKQEKWISENLQKMPSVKIAMGVGGSFDYISGNIKRAPCWIRKIGLEWIYRLFNQPRRFWRIFNATISFTYIALKEKFL